MTKRISELTELLVLDGTEEIPVAKGGENFKVKSGLLGFATKQTLGLDLVDNTPDADKPVSTAVQTALAEKTDVGHVHEVTALPGLQAFINEAIVNNGSSVASVVSSSNEW